MSVVDRELLFMEQKLTATHATYDAPKLSLDVNYFSSKSHVVLSKCSDYPPLPPLDLGY